MASSVEKRMALALPVLRMDRFCGVMSTPSDKSFSRILRWARTTSRLTMMGISLNRQFLFLANFPRLVNQPADEEDEKAGEQIAHINPNPLVLLQQKQKNHSQQKIQNINPTQQLNAAHCFCCEQNPLFKKPE